MEESRLISVLQHLCAKYPELASLIKDGAEMAAIKGGALGQADLSFVLSYPPGHFYSPLPSLEEVRRVAPKAWGEIPEALPGINLQTRAQQQLFAKLSKRYKDIPYKDGESGGLRYCFDNDIFCYGDAVVLYCMLQEFRPRRFVEVGSGYSSCVALDVCDQGVDMECVFIEPYPDRLHSLLRPTDYARVRIVEDFVQNAPMELFTSLEANDVLFIDSSHVGKIGSDVLFELFELLPRLKQGVIVHFHDVFYPFEYPRDWVERMHRAWNENYFLRAFLLHNNAWEIMYFNNYIGKVFPDMLRKWMPLCLKNVGGSLWLRKTAE